MAQAQHYAMHYQDIEIRTADQFQLVLLLYKGAIKHLNLAKRYQSEADIEQRVRSINKATALIGELQAALDFKNGGEIAASLNRLYSYMLKRLFNANAKQDPAQLDEVIQLLSVLRSAWEEARGEFMSGIAINPPQAQAQNQSVRTPQLTAG